MPSGSLRQALESSQRWHGPFRLGFQILGQRLALREKQAQHRPQQQGVDFAADVEDVEAMLQEQEVDFAADVSSLADTMVDVTGSFEVPGLLHIIHNAGRSLEHTIMLFSEAAQV